MEVMTSHQFFDKNIVEIRWDGHKDNRMIYFDDYINKMLLNKNDVIALAKHFGFILFEKESQL